MFCGHAAHTSLAWQGRKLFFKKAELVRSSFPRVTKKEAQVITQRKRQTLLSAAWKEGLGLRRPSRPRHSFPPVRSCPLEVRPEVPHSLRFPEVALFCCCLFTALVAAPFPRLPLFSAVSASVRALSRFSVAFFFSSHAV